MNDDVPAAVEYAKRYVTGAIERSFQIGHGARILNHFWQLSL
jgi:hydroxymethylpyrimidine/phosphomethylpyrimidine kinase